MVLDESARIARYQQRAAEAREAAARVSDPAQRRNLEVFAEAYDRLAEREQRRRRR